MRMGVRAFAPLLRSVRASSCDFFLSSQNPNASYAPNASPREVYGPQQGIGDIMPWLAATQVTRPQGHHGPPTV